MRKMSFVDADVFITFFTGADTKRVTDCRALFQDAVEGRAKLFSSAVVLMKVAWVLEKEYGWGKKEVADNLKLILNTPNLKFRSKEMLYRVVDVYGTLGIEIVDAYHMEVIEETKANTVYTFRHEIEKCPGLIRLEPGAMNKKEK